MEQTKRMDRSILRRVIFISIIIGILVSSVVLYFYRSWQWFLVSLVLSIVVIVAYYLVRKALKKTARITKIETAFPDFLQLMSSNLRAGMTIDKALLLSVRPEFAPLDKEILQTGKDLTTGKDIESSLKDLSKRINSSKIHRTILLLISGIRAGGDLAILLEQTAVSMRERGFVEKKAASSVLMYVIFIFLAVSMFAPALFSLSTVLVEVLTNILAGVPQVDANVNMPFTFSNVNISVNFIKYFSITFMILIDFFAALVLGLVSKGDEKQGLRYLPIMVGLGLAVFFLSRVILGQFLVGLL